MRLLAAGIMITICLILVLSVWLVIEIPRQAEISFGPPSRKLDYLKRTELSIRLLLESKTLLQSASDDGSVQEFQIKSAESTFSITNRLEEVGLITSADAMRDFLVYSGLDTTLQAGKFNLNRRMTPVEIATALQDSTPEEVTFTILAGWRIEEINNSLPTSGLEFAPDLFLYAVNNPSANLWVTKELPPGASLEGFFFPDRYRFNRKVSIQGFLETVLQNFNLKVDQKLRESFQQQGLTLFQAVTLASIVQREAVLEEEMPLIASVFFNRLEAGMKLDTDPTVQYALGYDQSKKSWWKNPLSLKDLKVNSPYNTYLNPGLPPGPISNPGLAALRAVAHPEITNFLYFRAACDGSGRHAFSETFNEHQRNACP